MFGLIRNFDRPSSVAQPVLPEQITCNGRKLTLTVTRNARAKRLTLRIERDGSGVRVTVPPHIRAPEIMQFLDRHQDWLKAKLAEYPDLPALKNGAKIPILGKPHRIVLKPGLRGLTKIVQSADGPELHIFASEDRIGKRIADFLKAEAKLYITPQAIALAEQTGKRARSVRFKDTTTRWGSCTSDGHLSFSWRIMMASPKVVHYLVAHEVAHLTEMNHGPNFWALCEKLCPDMDVCRAWLKRNGQKLQSIPL